MPVVGGRLDLDELYCLSQARVNREAESEKPLRLPCLPLGLSIVKVLHDIMSASWLELPSCVTLASYFTFQSVFPHQEQG